MAVPKKKVSRKRGRNRRASSYFLSLPRLMACPQCHKMKLAHRVCKFCGYYDGKQVIEMAADEK